MQMKSIDMKRIGSIALVFAAFVGLAFLALRIPVGDVNAVAEGSNNNFALIVFDFGNGTYRHAWVEPSDGLNATLAAGKELNMDINYTMSAYGAFVNSINGLDANSTVFWILEVWNTSSSSWEPSPVGISSLNAEPGTYICWYYGSWGNSSSFDPETVPLPSSHTTSEDTNTTTSEDKANEPIPVSIWALPLAISIAVIIGRRIYAY